MKLLLLGLFVSPIALSYSLFWATLSSNISLSLSFLRVTLTLFFLGSFICATFVEISRPLIKTLLKDY